MSLRRSGLVVSLLALTTALGTAPVGALPEAPPLLLTPTSGPVGTTVTVRNDAANGRCTGGLLGRQGVDIEIVSDADDEIDSTNPAFAPGLAGATGDWTATFTVPAGLVPGDEIRVAAACTGTAAGGSSIDFLYQPALFTVTAAATTAGGTTTTLRPGTTATAIPQGGGSTLVPTPLAIQPRFTG